MYEAYLREAELAILLLTLLRPVRMSQSVKGLLHKSEDPSSDP